MRRMAAEPPAPDRTSLPSTTSPAGLDLAPLRGVRYATQNGNDLARLTCPPYDVIDEELQAALEAADPHNVIRLILPRDGGADPEAPYRNAASTLRDWLSTGVLVPDTSPALYVYEMRGGGTAVRGLIGALRLLGADAGVVLPHEDTMPGPVRHRLRLIEATDANLEPIFLVAEGAPGAAAQAVTDAEHRPPLIDVMAPDGSRHRLWAIDDAATLAEIATDLLPRRALIADGHHRYEAYLQNQAARRNGGDADGPWDRGLAFLVDAAAFGARVQAFHRVVLGLGWDEAVRRAGTAFRVAELPGGERAAMRALEGAGHDGAAFVLTDGARWLLLTDPYPELVAATLPAHRSAAWRGLDVVVLHHVLLTALWNVDISEQTVRYVADPATAIKLADERAGIAVLLNPTPLDTVLAVAAAGERMPQKSTLFVPKPRTGLVLRTYDNENAHRAGGAYAEDAADGSASGPAR
jgi:uncharacterized protein (DUF1015 family)